MIGLLVACRDPAPALTVGLGDDDPLSARLVVDGSARVTCEGDGQRHVVDVDGAAVLHGLTPATTYACTTDGDSAPVALTTAPLPAGLAVPELTVPSTDPDALGYFLFDACQLEDARPRIVDAAMLVVDGRGRVRWWWPEHGCDDVDATYLGDGRFLFGGKEGVTFVDPTIVDLDRQVELTGPPGTWNHDVGVSEDGASLYALGYEGSGDGWWGFTIDQLDASTGDPLWRWSSIDDGLARGALPAVDGTAADPWHANAVVDRAEAGSTTLYVDVRNLNQVLAIDRDTKAVLWRVGVGGDFRLLEADGAPASDDRWFFYPHDAKLQGDLLVVHDNGYGRSAYGGVDGSRALALRLDVAARTATVAFEWTEPGWLEKIWGGVDRLDDGAYLVAQAHREAAPLDDHPSSIVRVTADGSVDWRLTWPDPWQTTYRAEAIDGCALFDDASICAGD